MAAIGYPISASPASAAFQQRLAHLGDACLDRTVRLSGSDISSSQSSCAKQSVSHPATILSKVEAWHGYTLHLTASRE